MKNIIRYKDTDIEYSLSRSKRKTIGISIKPDKGVHISSPYKVSDKYIQDIVLKKGDWILKKLDQMNSAAVRERQYVSGETINILGNPHMLEIKYLRESKKVKIDNDGSRLIVFVPENIDVESYKSILKKALESWIKEFAIKVITDRIKFFSCNLNLKPNKVYFKSQKTIWGSCTRSNNININWRIIMAPQGIVDYLVVHELVHIRVKNHSKTFWSAVEEILPDYDVRRKWLKHNGNKLFV